MAMDADLAALLVRATARVSAVILSASLLAAARRIGGPQRAAPRTNGERARRLDVAAFIAFIVSQTIHFICVALLTIATAGANIDGPGGYPAVVAVGLLFYAGCAAVLRVKRRASVDWTTPRQRRIELWSLLPIWLVFFVAYASRGRQSWLFAALAIVLLLSMARFVSTARQVSRSELRSRQFANPL